jgi:hypothetical protein
MANLLEQAIDCDDADRAARIIQTHLVSSLAMSPTMFSQRNGPPIVCNAPALSANGSRPKPVSWFHRPSFLDEPVRLAASRRAVTPSSRSPAMDIYNLTEVDTIMDGKRGVLLRGFNIIGVHGRPVVTLSFETQVEAEAAQKATLPVVRAAKLITPHVVS